MANIESPQERQENEMLALKSIFVHELRDLRSDDGWKDWRPLNIYITLTPQQGSTGLQEVHARTDLHVKCSNNYPDEVPDIKLENSKGLSVQQVVQLKTELDQLALDLKGEVMIFELAQHVQKFLHSNNKPRFNSFYEEMVSRQKLQEQKNLHLRKIKEDKERQAIRDEIQQRQEALLEEKRHRRELRLSQQEPLDSTYFDSNLVAVEKSRSCPYIRNFPLARRRCQSTSESSEGSQCEHRGTQLLHFTSRGDRQVHRGKCIGHSVNGSVVYAGVDLMTGELLAISEWSLKCHPPPNSKKSVTFRDVDAAPNELANYMKQISSIEQELNYLQKLHHPNLVHYLNMKYTQDKENLIIYTLQEFVIGTNITFYLSEHLPMDNDLLRHCALGILSALSFLHHNNIVHKDLRDTSVFIDKSGCIKVSDYSLDKRLSDMHQAAKQVKAESPYPQSLGRGGKKADIYRLGIILLSLVRGYIITDELPDLPTHIQPDLKDFISKCLLEDERQRWSAEQLFNHQFMKTPIERGVSPQVSIEDNQVENGENEVDEEPELDIHLFMLPNSKGQSRIQNEFEVLKWLGKGAFGDVLKVRNKLDGGIYAIKRIELNPKNKQLNRKITREVKLLSRLNHENVVRYFNSWIESATIEPTTSVSSIAPSPTGDPETNLANSSEDIEKMAPPMKDVAVDWNVSYGSRASVIRQDSVTSDESSDDEDWISYLPRSESSDGIVFEKDGSETSESNADSRCNSQVSNNLNEGELSEDKDEMLNPKEIQFMYIQMEFCEKSTLRIAIDNGLSEDDERVWRLFREMVEGLAHIHQQGMIHRDLKPVNIFLDSNDHVKIGDFGLATTNILPRAPSSIVPSQEPIPPMIERRFFEGSSYSKEVGDGMTGQVGTALYVAPELDVSTGKAVYNQKVDIYSLGIMFFEMCYHPLSTGMERVSVLANLRHKEIDLPPDFSDSKQKVEILRWLLNHDPGLRPTSHELLQSEYLPPPQLEEAELQEMVKHTLSTPQSKSYKYLVAACFSQEVTAAQDILFDMSASKGAVITRQALLAQDMAREAVVHVFRKHGATCLSTPLLIPRAKMYETTDSCVQLMTHSGGIVHVPHDLRVPFARYIATNGVSNFRRYAVDRVYREKKVFGSHPRELYECAFDIVTPTPGSLMAEAELLAVAWEVVNEFPRLRERNCRFRLNHTLLLRAILVHCGIEEEKYQDIYNILGEMRDEKYTKFQVQTRLISLCLTDQAIVTLFSLIETESPISKVASAFKTITKRRGEVASLAKQGLMELENIISNAEALGVKCPIVVAPSLVYNVAQYSGMMCQLVCEQKKKRKRGGLDVIAAGGRYDNMLANFRQTLEMTNMVAKEVSQSAAGISISLDKIVSSLLDGECVATAVDVVVCSVGQRVMLREKASVMRELWAAGIRSSLIDTAQSLEDIQDFCREILVPHIVMLKDTEPGTLRVRSWERDRFQERKVNLAELVEVLQRLLRSNEGADTTPALQRADSKAQTNDANLGQSSANQQVNISFVTMERYPANTRRRFENQMDTHITPTLQRLSSKIRVEVLALNLEPVVIKTLAMCLELEDQQDFQKSIGLVIEKHPRYKKYLITVCDKIFELKFEQNCPVIILYSLSGNTFKLLM